MTRQITHHIPLDLLRDWAAGRLAAAFATVIAAHVALCDDCRAAWEAEDLLAGELLDRMTPAPVGLAARERMFAALDHAVPVLPREAKGVLPAPVMELTVAAPRWQSLGGGIRQQILLPGPEASLRLLHIPSGRKVPEHGHGGLELTLVLEGSFSDSEGRFGRGDVECAGNDTNHQPVAGDDGPCLCLAATDAPLRFRGLVPRLLQPLFGI